jgi:hypothetical protein
MSDTTLAGYHFHICSALVVTFIRISRNLANFLGYCTSKFILI